MNKLGQCDCESEFCERGDHHVAGSCSDEAVFRVKVYGEFQNLCEDCNERTKACFTGHSTAYVLVEDRRRKV